MACERYTCQKCFHTFWFRTNIDVTALKLEPTSYLTCPECNGYLVSGRVRSSDGWIWDGWIVGSFFVWTLFTGAAARSTRMPRPPFFWFYLVVFAALVSVGVFAGRIALRRVRERSLHSKGPDPTGWGLGAYMVFSAAAMLLSPLIRRHWPFIGLSLLIPCLSWMLLYFNLFIHIKLRTLRLLRTTAVTTLYLLFLATACVNWLPEELDTPLMRILLWLGMAVVCCIVLAVTTVCLRKAVEKRSILEFTPERAVELLGAEEGGDVNGALYRAARAGEVAVARQLLAQGADPNAVFGNLTPLDVALGQQMHDLLSKHRGV